MKSLVKESSFSELLRAAVFSVVDATTNHMRAPYPSPQSHQIPTSPP